MSGLSHSGVRTTPGQTALTVTSRSATSGPPLQHGRQHPLGHHQHPAEIVTAAGHLSYTFERRQDAPADAILAEAGARAAGPGRDPVIVVGRSGHAAHQVLGSVPVRLQHHSPFPVITIP